GADSIGQELKTWTSAPVLQTVATEGQGIEELVEVLSQVETTSIRSNRENPQRLQAEARALVRFAVEKQLDERLKAVRRSSDLPALLSKLNM
ncbi:MAG TPA: hypothetical protein VFV50_17980, partial [Bdellovibrionales bacterium]|nr:hypothetical protein [Bdellovibrionales bacterium]